MNLEIDSGAIADIKESISYYTSVAGNGDEFESELYACLDRIVAAPEAYQVLDGAKYRRCLFSRFPYGVFYKIMDDYIYIIAVAHHKRKPHFWINRESNN